MEQVKFRPKDAKIIKDNPGKSPYELKDLGLSNKAFERLMEQPSMSFDPLSDEALEDEDPEEDETELLSKQTLPNPSDKLTGNPATGRQPLIPKVTSISNQMGPAAPNLKVLPEQVIVVTPRGQCNPMGREFALKLVQQDTRYKILQ